jgi:hypothetical protein
MWGDKKKKDNREKLEIYSAGKLCGSECLVLSGYYIVITS